MPISEMEHHVYSPTPGNNYSSKINANDNDNDNGNNQKKKWMGNLQKEINSIRPLLTSTTYNKLGQISTSSAIETREREK